MAQKHWRIEFKGEKTVDEIQAAVGGHGGIVTRVHVEGGATRVYFFGDRSVTKDLARAVAGSEPVEVAADEVTRLD